MGRLHFSDQKEENNLADKNLKARIVNKNGTSAEWEKATSFVPKKGELILYTDLNKIKIGDGVTKVNDLPFLTVPNKTSDLTNDSGYITNTSVDTKLKDKVSKAGDTMTGNLAMSNHKITDVAAPAANTDAANKKYVDDAIPTAQIEELSSAVAKAEPFIVEVTMTTSNEISVNKTFAEIKTASDAGKLCYARITNSGIIVPLVAFDLRIDKKVAVFSSSKLSISHFNTVSLLIAEDNSVSTETFDSQSLIKATGLLKGNGQGGITAAVAGTDYAAVSHTHTKANITDFPTSMTPTAHKNTHKTGGSDALTPADIGAVAVTDLIAYTATEIDTMWNAVTIN